MRISVFGVGSFGGQLARALTAAGHRVMVTGSRDAGKLRRVAAEVGGDAVAGSPVEAAAFGELSVMAIPFQALDTLLAEGVREALEGRIVIDAINPVTADGMGLTVGFRTSAAEELARTLPGSRVVKAFNTVFAQTLRTPTVDGRRLVVPVASDDEVARKAVLDLVADLGFDGVDAGPLRNARYLEPMAELVIQLGYVSGYGNRIGFSLQR